MDNLLGKQKQHRSPAYDWVGNLTLSSANTDASKSWTCVVLAKTKDQLEVTSTLDKSQAEPLIKALDELSWNPSQKPIKVITGENKFLAVAKKDLKVSDRALFRQMGLDVAGEASTLTAATIAIDGLSQLDEAAFLEGLLVGFDRSGAFKSKTDLQWPAAVVVSAANLKACELAKKMAQAQIFTRWLQDAPSNFMNSEMLAEISNDLFADKAKLKILGRKEMQDQGMGSLLAVAAGTPIDPKLIAIEFAGVDQSQTVVLVGKGVTFDAGGINIKPSAGLEDMKYDMSGAAAVLGAAHFFSQEKPPVNVVCAIGAVENMCSATAFRPGDIVKSMSGKTIEILNTDAEGRLVLADVMTYVQREYKPDLLLDMATLTGAVLMGLGHAGSAFMTNDSSVVSLLNKTSETQGEALWQLPLWPELAEEVKSEFADLKNLPAANVRAGTIMGGHFLNEFVEDGVQWAHIDIAGTAWNCSATGYPKKGGSGFGLRTLIGACYELVES